MLAALPLLTFIFLAIAVKRWPAGKGRMVDWRFSVLLAAVIWGLFLAAATECLSLGNLINEFSFVWLWAVATMLAAVACVLAARRHGAKGAVFPVRVWVLGMWNSFLRLDRVERGLLFAVFVLVSIIFITAAISAPSWADSMSYHLPRVEHWIQNANLWHYPTHVTRQLYMPPMAEYVVLHLWLLSGGDRLCNLVEFAAMIGCLVAVSWIAMQLGASRRAQVYSVVACATIPMGVIQASSTQTDYVFAFWLCCLAGSVLAVRDAPSWPHLLFAAGSLALAVLTKGLAYIYAPLLIIWLAVATIRAMRWHAWKPTLAIVVIVFALNASQWLRNEMTFGTITGFHGGAPSSYLLSNRSLSPGIIASNIVRNISLYIILPSQSWNRQVEAAVLWFHRCLRLDPDDWRSTAGGGNFFVPEFHCREDFAPNTLHFMLAMATLVMAARIKPGKDRGVLIYAICVVGAFLLFCAVVQWQQWGSRLHLPLFVLLCPVIGITLARLAEKRLAIAAWMMPAVVGVVLAGLLGGSLPFALCNEARPILGDKSIFFASREQVYFAFTPDVQADFQSAAEVIVHSGARNIGLYMDEPGMEYLLWVLLKDRVRYPLRFEHFDVKNASVRLAGSPFQPQVIAVWSDPTKKAHITVLVPTTQGKAP